MIHVPILPVRPPADSTPTVLVHRGDDDASPLYCQIAARLRFAIATGQLRAGDCLPSLRQAQHLWGVNLHTVRRAYHELQTDGLVTVHRGSVTTVVGRASLHPGTLRELVATMLEVGQRAFGASPTDIVETLREMSAAAPQVAVVECSRALAEQIARQLEQVWQIKTTACLLTDAVAGDHPVVSTLFHIDDMHRNFPRHPAGTYCVRVGLAGALIAQLNTCLSRGSLQQVVIVETDHSLALAIATELRAIAGWQLKVDVQIPADIEAFLATRRSTTVALISPRHWDNLRAHRRAAANTLPLQYDVVPEDLHSLGQRLGWRRIDTP